MRLPVERTTKPAILHESSRPALLLALVIASGACRARREQPTALSASLAVGPAPDPSAQSAASCTNSASPAESARATEAPRAPSLDARSAIDARDAQSLAHCMNLRTGEAKAAMACGEHDPPPLDRDRFLASALELDGETRAHVISTATRGKALGLNPHAFGLVGDSITVSRDFLGSFSGYQRNAVSIDSTLLKNLDVADGLTVVDYFRGVEITRSSGKPWDSFAAPRAAKVGARTSWAFLGGADSPVARMVGELRPAIAIVSYGANDASYRTAAPEELADEIDKNLTTLLADLEDRGVVVILENEMRHGDQPGVKACPSDDPQVNDWRIAVSTNATSARAAEVAARQHLPFVDVRYALDAAVNHGLGPDAVHPSVHRRGGGLLTREGLDCGYNIRNLVSLLELAKVVSVLQDANVFPPGKAESATFGEPTKPTKTPSVP